VVAVPAVILEMAEMVATLAAVIMLDLLVQVEGAEAEQVLLAAHIQVAVAALELTEKEQAELAVA
jgi:hypothetical protein